MIPGLLHSKCISGGNCTKFCTSFKRVVDSTSDKCGWCLHDICEHNIIGVIDSLGVPTLLPSPAAPQLLLTIPVTTVRERNCGTEWVHSTTLLRPLFTNFLFRHLDVVV